MSEIKIKGARFLQRALDKFEHTMPRRIEQALRDALLKPQPRARRQKRRSGDERPEHP